MRLVQSLLVLCAFVSPSLAQPLADRVPGEAMVYVGWRGTSDPGAAFKGSRFETITKQSPFGQLIDQAIPAAVKIAQQKKPEWREPLATVQVIATQVMKYPTAFFLAGIDDQGKGAPPRMRFGFVSRAGADAPALLNELERLVQLAPREWKGKAFVTDDVVSVVFGYEDGKVALAGALAGEGEGRPAALKTNEAFTRAVARVNPDPSAIVFVNTQAIVARIEQIVKTESPEGDAAAKTRIALEESGLAGIRSMVWTGGFAGRDWEERCFVDSPAPRKGLLALAENKPFNVDLLKRVPEGATMVQAQRFDLSKFLGEVRRVVKAVDPAGEQTMDQVLGVATLAVGKNIENDVIDPLGDEWVVYSAPEIGGESATGLVVVSKLDNAMKARLGLSSVSIFTSSLAVMATNNQDFKLSGRMVKVDDLNIYYFTSPLVAPAWTVKDGYLYAGFYPQTVAAAAKYAGKSLAESPKFIETLGRLEQGNINGFTYIDVPRMLPRAYPGALAVTRTLMGAIDMTGAQAPEMMLPALPTILNESTPAGAVVWMDEAGLNGRGVSPFPGAVLLSRAAMVSDTAGPLAGLLAPALVQAQQAGDVTRSVGQMRTIGQALVLYSNDNKGVLPASLATVYEGLYVQAPLRSPFSKPGDEDAGYVYLGKEVKITSLKEPATMPIAYDAAMMSATGKVAVLFMDGHVETKPAAELIGLLKTAREAGLNAD